MNAHEEEPDDQVNLEDEDHVEDDDSEPLDEEEEEDSDNAARESLNDDEILDKGNLTHVI